MNSATGGLRLHKFVLNGRDVLANISPSDHATNVRNIDLSFNDLPLERALRIHWNVDSDHSQLCVSLKDQPATLCGIVSTVTSLFDPLGFVAAALFRAKIILQEMCR